MDVLNHWTFLQMDPPEDPVGSSEAGYEASSSDKLFVVERLDDAPDS